MSETNGTIETPDAALKGDFVATIAGNYLANNSMSSNDIPNLISTISNAFDIHIVGAAQVEAAPEKKEPAVSVRKSITPDYLICLEDGRKFKSLKRHLHTKYNLTPDAYRAKWGLPKDYPMVAPAYAQARSDLAKQMGLGRGGRQPPKKAKAARKAANA